ncbi:MAG TPA: DUF1761 domain-containing protein [Gemmatimonadales bacterium]
MARAADELEGASEYGAREPCCSCCGGRRRVGAGLALAYLLACLAVLVGVGSCMSAIQFGLFLWIGFPVILLAGSVLWGNVPWRVAAIHAGDWLVKSLVIAIIVSVWH